MSDFNTLLAVKDLMTKDIVTTNLATSVSDAARIMAEKEITSVLLTDDDGVLTGIITDTDIVRKIIATNDDPAVTPCGNIMNQHVHNIPGDTSIFDARKIMTDSEVKHLIIVENNKPIGLIGSSALLGS